MNPKQCSFPYMFIYVDYIFPAVAYSIILFGLSSCWQQSMVGWFISLLVSRILMVADSKWELKKLVGLNAGNFVIYLQIKSCTN